MEFPQGKYKYLVNALRRVNYSLLYLICIDHLLIFWTSCRRKIKIECSIIILLKFLFIAYIFDISNNENSPNIKYV